jgi:hypothetical protein
MGVFKCVCIDLILRFCVTFSLHISYYYNTATKETTWELPPGAVVLNMATSASPPLSSSPSTEPQLFTSSTATTSTQFASAAPTSPTSTTVISVLPSRSAPPSPSSPFGASASRATATPTLPSVPPPSACRQFGVLVRKHLRVKSHMKCATLVEFLVPTFFFVLLMILSWQLPFRIHVTSSLNMDQVKNPNTIDWSIDNGLACGRQWSKTGKNENFGTRQVIGFTSFVTFFRNNSPNI